MGVPSLPCDERSAARNLTALHKAIAMNTTGILFLQGGGKGAHAADQLLADSLGRTLGPSYQVLFPEVPGEAAPRYPAYETLIEAGLQAMGGQVILVGHSLGACLLLKFLAEHKADKKIAGLFLVATPFWGKGGWEFEGFAIDNARAAAATAAIPTFFYQGTADETVSFNHLALYQAVFPHATFREITGGDHQLRNDLSIVAADIVAMGAQHASGNT